MDTKELETLDPLHTSPFNVNGGLFSPLFPVVHDQLICLAHIAGEVVVLAPHWQYTDLLPISHLIVVGDQAYHGCVVSKLNDGVGVVFGHSVVGEQGIQERSKYTPLRGPSVKNQHGRLVVAYSYHLGTARREVQDPVAERGVKSQSLSLVMSFVGTMVLNAELYSMNSILT